MRKTNDFMKIRRIITKVVCKIELSNLGKKEQVHQ